MKRPIENNSSPGQAVYEPFSGSGTTIIADFDTLNPPVSAGTLQISPASTVPAGASVRFRDRWGR